MLYCHPSHVIQPFRHKNFFNPDQNLSRVCIYLVCMRVTLHLSIAGFYLEICFIIKNDPFSFVWLPTRLTHAHKIGQTPKRFCMVWAMRGGSMLRLVWTTQSVNMGTERKLLPLPSYWWCCCVQCKRGLKAIETAVFCLSYLKRGDICVHQIISLYRMLRLWGWRFCRKNNWTDVLRQSWSTQKVRRILQKAQFKSQIR